MGDNHKNIERGCKHSNAASQKRAGQAQLSRRSSHSCMVLFLLLVLIVTLTLVEVNPSQLSIIWSHGWWRKDGGISTNTIYDQYFVSYPHEYHFLVDEEEKCREQNPFLVLMVPVAPHNRAARDAVRSTWGKESLVLGKVVRLFFLLALPSGEGREKVQEEVLQESREQRDLLQSDFRDSYKNLTIKTMVMLEWLSSRCTTASYAMKIDSDMFLNVHNLVSMLLRAPKYNYMTGLVAREAPVLRDPSSKWYLPEEVLSESPYPPYAMGLGYVFTLDLPIKLVEASRQVKAIYIEDVYLGLCMKHLGITPTDPPSENLFQAYPPSTQDRCYYHSVITTILETPKQLLDVWRDLQTPGLVC